MKRVTKFTSTRDNSRHIVFAMSAIERRRSTLSKLDDGLLIVAIVVGVVFALSILSLVVHAVFWMLKLAVIALVIAFVFRLVNRRSS
jgi:hypothetical protein